MLVRPGYKRCPVELNFEKTDQQKRIFIQIIIFNQNVPIQIMACHIVSLARSGGFDLFCKDKGGLAVVWYGVAWRREIVVRADLWVSLGWLSGPCGVSCL